MFLVASPEKLRQLKYWGCFHLPCGCLGGTGHHHGCHPSHSSVVIKKYT